MDENTLMHLKTDSEKLFCPAMLDCSHTQIAEH